MHINFNNIRTTSPYFCAKKFKKPLDIIRTTGLKDIKGQNLYLYDGLILDQDGKNFTGSAIGFNAKDEEVALFTFENGKIKESSSYRNDEEKKYFYNQPMMSKADGKVEFQDKSALYKQTYFSYPLNTTIIRRKNGKESLIYRNPNPRYNNEATYVFHSSDKHYETITSTGVDRTIPFKTAKEAKEFFKNEFGIDIDYFASVAEAVIWYDAVMMYKDIHYKNQEKLFDGLQIAHEDMRNDDGSADITTIANASATRFYMTDELKKKHSEGLLTLEDLDKYTENDVSRNDVTIRINTNYDIDRLEDSTVENYMHNQHPYHLAKTIYAHELAHYIHFSNLSGKDTLFVELSTIPKYVADVVCEYAGTSPAEFVAEYISARLEGKKYPDYVNREYLKFHGPDLFNDLQGN